MNMKKSKHNFKIVGIIGRPYKDNDNTKFIGINENIRKSIINKGCIPLIINPINNFKFDKDNTKKKLNIVEKEYYKGIINICDGLIISGGIKWYNYDRFIVKYAIQKNIPILGICMGMQLLASLDIGEKNLDKNITNHYEKNKYHHKVFILDNTILKTILNKNVIKVNSRHNYHIKSCNNFNISAYSSDGLIEAIEMPSKKCVIGLQWHPEDMLEYDIYANKIYNYFINKL